MPSQMRERRSSDFSEMMRPHTMYSLYLLCFNDHLILIEKHSSVIYVSFHRSNSETQSDYS